MYSGPKVQKLVMVVDYFDHCNKSTPVDQEINHPHTLCDKQKEVGPLYAEMEFRGKRVKLQVDCGATVNAHLPTLLTPQNGNLCNVTTKP